MVMMQVMRDKGPVGQEGETSSEANDDAFVVQSNGDYRVEEKCLRDHNGIVVVPILSGW